MSKQDGILHSWIPGESYSEFQRELYTDDRNDDRFEPEYGGPYEDDLSIADWWYLARNDLL